MSYPVNPNDPTTPTDQQGARQGAEEFRALKALVSSLAVASVAAPGVRQAIQSAKLDTNGYNAALTVGAGLRPGLSTNAGANPMHLSFAKGFNAGGPADDREALNADVVDILGADLPLSNTSFIYRNFGAGFGSTLIPPDYGYAFDKGRGVLCGFQGLDGAVVTTDDFGNTVILAGSTISTAQFKFGTSSLDCTGGGAKTGKITGVTSLGSDSWEIALWFRINALPTPGNTSTLFAGLNAGGFGVQTYLINNAGTTKLHFRASANGTSWGIIDVDGANTVWALNQWHRIRVVFDVLAGTYRTYLSLNGALETQDSGVASTVRTCAISEIDLAKNLISGTSQFDGWLGNFRILRGATTTTVEVPSAVAPTIADYKYNFFSIPEMKMYEATAASVAANTNPTLTPVSRLFLAEADTSGVAVTAVRNYALRGKYVSTDQAIPGTAVKLNFNHNLGTNFGVKASAWIRVYTPANGYPVGAINPAIVQTAASGLPFNPIVELTRNTVAIQSGDQANTYQTLGSGTGVAQSVSASLCKNFVIVERDW